MSERPKRCAVATTQNTCDMGDHAIAYEVCEQDYAAAERGESMSFRKRGLILGWTAGQDDDHFTATRGGDMIEFFRKLFDRLFIADEQHTRASIKSDADRAIQRSRLLRQKR